MLSFLDEWQELLRLFKKPTKDKIKAFLRKAATGAYGTSKRSILAEAKIQFGKEPDWEKILSVLLNYLPVLLSFLK